MLSCFSSEQHSKALGSTEDKGISRELSRSHRREAMMKSSTLLAILVLAVLAMGTFAAAAHEDAVTAAEGESKVGYFKKCCKNCRSFSGAVVCDDVSSKCHPDCALCRVVQVRPVKTFRCADGKTDDSTCGKC